MAIPIKAVLSVSTKGFTKGMNVATKALGGFVGLAGKVTIALTAVTAAFTALVVRQSAYIDRIGKVAKVTGLSAETLQKFRFAAEQAGVSGDNASLAIRRFSRRLGEAQKGTGELLPALKKLGIDTRAADGSFKSAEQVLKEFADGIANTENESEKLALAFKAFDSEGAELVTTLNQGAAGLEDMFTKAEALGGVLSTTAIQGVEDFNDSFNELQTLIAGVSNQFVASLAPALEKITEAFTEFLIETVDAQGGMENFGKFLKDQFIQGVVKVIEVFEALSNVMIDLFNLMKGAGRAFDENFGIDPANIARAKELREELESITKSGFDFPMGTMPMIIGQLAKQVSNGFKDGFTDPARAAEIQKELSKIFGDLKPADFSSIIDMLLGETEIEKAKEKIKTIVEDFTDVPGQTVTAKQGTFIGALLDKIYGDEGRARVDQFLTDFFDEAEGTLDKVKALTALIFGPELTAKVKEAFAQSDVGNYTKTLAEGMVKAATMFEDALAQAFINGKADFSDLADFIKLTLIKAFIQAKVTNPLLELFSFDGGGYTGSGPRTGGVDGRGGFLSILHPNETVVDHSRGMRGGGGGVTNVNYTINATSAESFQQLVASDPQFIYAVTQAGARSIPGAR